MGREKEIFVFLFVVLIFITVPSVHGLSLIGNKLSPITFEPGKIISNHYTIQDTDRQVEVSIGGELLQYIHVTEVVDNQFDLVIEVPDSVSELPEPGEYRFSLHAKEVSSTQGGGIGSSVSVNLVFIVIVPPHGKTISVSLEIPDVNERESVPISIHVESKGLEDIAIVKGFVTVYDQENKSVASVNFPGKPLLSLEALTLFASLPPDKLSTGTYWAEATVNYDGEERIARDNFKIGYLDLLLINYSSQLEQEFGEFWAIVENNWGNTIKTVYANVSIDGVDLLTTPTITLAPWQRGELKGILRTDFQPGNYSGKIRLFYDGLSKDQEIVFTIESSQGTESSVSSLMIIAGIAMVIVLVGLILMLLWKKKR